MTRLHTGISAAIDMKCQMCALFVNNVTDKIHGPNCRGNYNAGCAFWEPIVTKNQIGDMHVKITINKDEILRDLDEIRKKELALITRDDVIEKLRELFPPIEGKR